MGLGSSLLLRMQLDSALKELGLTAAVEVADISSAKAMAADLIATSPQFGEMLAEIKTPVIMIQNYLDKQEIKQKLSAALGQS
jgi:PTS system ascorbate-specific IIB component